MSSLGLRVFSLCGLLVSAAEGAEPVVAVDLPRPTGPHAAGRGTFHWTDAARGDVLAAQPSARRELMVDVWYPADGKASGRRADYLPDLTAMRRAVGDKALRDHLGTAYDVVAAGRVRTHAIEGAPFARGGGRRPVLVFSHGFGMMSRTYTAQLEDLASHGYVVAAIAHTYETLAVVFPDGRVAAFADEPWRANSGTEEASIAYGNVRSRAWADDMRFVLDRLRREDERREGQPPFAGHLDFGRVGAFGHSSGGRAAALVCALPARAQACLNQDGLAMNQPYDRGAAPRLEGAFLLFMRPRPTQLPPDEELSRMGHTRASAEALVRKIDADQDAAMESAGIGSYRVTLSMPGVSHDSFSDLAVLQATGDDARRTAEHNLSIVRTYTRAFFDRSLLGSSTTVLDAARADGTIKVEAFPRGGRRPGHPPR